MLPQPARKRCRISKTESCGVLPAAEPCGVLPAVMSTYRHAVMCCVAKVHREARTAALVPKGGEMTAGAPVRLRLVPSTAAARGGDAARCVDVHTAVQVTPGSIFDRRQSLCTTACSAASCYACMLRLQRETLLGMYPSGIWWATETSVPQTDPVWLQLNECVAKRVRLGRVLRVQAVNNVLQRCAYDAACATRATLRPSTSEEGTAAETEMLLWHGSRSVHPMRIALDPRGVDPSVSRGGLLGTAAYFTDNPL